MKNSEIIAINASKRTVIAIIAQMAIVCVLMYDNFSTGGEGAMNKISIVSANYLSFMGQ